MIGLDAAVADRIAARDWLQANLTHVTGLPRRLAQIGFAFLPWWPVFQQQQQHMYIAAAAVAAESRKVAAAIAAAAGATAAGNP